MERSQFTFYQSFAQAIMRIKKPAERCAAYDALVNYALYGAAPDCDKLPDSVAIVFDLVLPVLEKGRNKAANRQNKSETNEKQTKNKSEQNEILPSLSNIEGEKEREREKEKEKEKEREYNLLSKPGGGLKIISETTPKKQIENKSEDVWGFGEDLKDALRLWMDYKKEKRQTVKPAQVDALLKQVKNYTDKYGEEAVASVIRSSIANGYAGIVFDRLDKQAPEKEKPWNRGVMRHGDVGVDAPTDADLERLRVELGR